MIKVYFESKNHTEIVAIFQDEDLYIQCLPTLKKQAKKDRMIVTESIIDQEIEN